MAEQNSKHELVVRFGALSNDFLFKIGLKANEKCTFCQEGIWTCHETSNFWKR